MGLDVSAPAATGMIASRVLGRSFAPSSPQSGVVRAFIQTREYTSLATQQTAALRDAAVLQGVCRTERAWVDRTRLRVSFQAKDDLGSPLVLAGSYQQVMLLVASDSLEIRVVCGLALSAFYLGHCSITHAADAWFAGGGTRAEVSIQTKLADGTSISAALGSIHFVGQPAWYDPQLRSSSVTTERAPPPGFNASVGLFITLPSSPVYAGGASVETFFANVYVHTRGDVANSWRLMIFFNTSVLEYVSVEVCRCGATATTRRACKPTLHRRRPPAALQAHTCTRAFGRAVPHRR